jgi:hypothetical protein
MNLFYLDEDLDKCAEYHVDKHVVKMILEAAQLLCTTMWIDEYFGYVPRPLTKEENAKLSTIRKEWKEVPLEERKFPYLATMQNHPSAVWVRTSFENFCWTHNYANALNEEYCYRYGKRHKSVEDVINKLPDPKHIEQIGFTTFALAMPDVLKNYDDPIQSYRDYYHLDKATFASWKNREKPHWWNEDLADYDERITARKN